MQGIYRANLSMLTDLYQLTMAYGYHKTGIAEREAVFHLYYRCAPFILPPFGGAGGRCVLVAGVATVWLANNEKAFDRGAMERAFGERS